MTPDPFDVAMEDAMSSEDPNDYSDSDYLYDEVNFAA